MAPTDYTPELSLKGVLPSWRCSVSSKGCHHPVTSSRIKLQSENFNKPALN